MDVKRFIFLIITSFCLLAIIIGCDDSNITTTSYIKVLKKESTKNDFWISVINPYDSKAEMFKLATEQNVWNLIINNEIYLVSYKSKTNDNFAIIESINYPK
ncbi:hypothetical protein [Paenibacillus sanfengchensis]|uniref:hypothetical protein n=1 Tax=Paenibacillus sanfengchensis TaxID=3119819 RepID=UPI002FE23C36